MTQGFSVEDQLPYSPQVVWDYLTDFSHAQDWMTGVQSMVPLDTGSLRIGSRFRFESRGKLRESEVTAVEPGRKVSLTSTQGGVTATYEYLLEPVGQGTAVRLNAVCSASGLWKLLHPIIVIAMRRSDSTHLARLKAAMARHYEATG